MALRTKEKLQQLLQESRERQARKKEKLKQDKYKLNLQQERQFRLEQKTLLQQEKLKKMEELYLLAQKPSQKQNKQPPSKLKTYHSTTIERFSSDDELYTTREQLMEAEDRGEGKINWSVWDRLVEESKYNNKPKTY